MNSDSTIESLIKNIEGLSIAQLNELVETFCKRFNIDPASLGASTAAQASTDNSKDQKEDGNKMVSLWINSLGNKMEVIKVLMKVDPNSFPSPAVVISKLREFPVLITTKPASEIKLLVEALKKVDKDIVVEIK